jgi:hypothetical protein
MDLSVETYVGINVYLRSFCSSFKAKEASVYSVVFLDLALSLAEESFIAAGTCFAGI